MSLPDAVRDRETRQDTISQQEVATLTTCLYKLKPWWGETASRECQVWKRDPCYRRLGNLFSQATMKVLQSIANYRSLLFCCGVFLRAKFLLNSFLLSIQDSSGQHKGENNNSVQSAIEGQHGLSNYPRPCQKNVTTLSLSWVVRACAQCQKALHTIRRAWGSCEAQ